MTPLRLEVRDLTKSFYDVAALDGVDLDVSGGEVHALLGENGAGKSTLCAVLAGLYRPDRGRVTLDGVECDLRSPHHATQAGIGMVYQHFRLVERFTVAENIALGWPLGGGRRTGRRMERHVAELAAGFGLHIDPGAPVWQLSVGERQRVEVLKQLVRGAKVLILDEPTAVLAPQEAELLFVAVRQLADRGHAIVLVSHKLDEILGHTDRVTVLRRGRNAGGGPTAGMTPTSLAAMMFGTTEPTERPPASPEPAAPGTVVLQVDGLHVIGDHGRPAVDDVSFTVRRGQIVGVAGVAGNGQRELHEAVAGLRPTQAGTVTIDGRAVRGGGPAARIRAGLGYVPEDRLGTGLAAGLPLEDNLVLKRFAHRPYAQLGLCAPSAVRRTTATLTHDFDVRGARPGLPVSFMSGGNLQKAILARELTEPHEVLVAAAPTRGLDLAATRAVRDHLRDERERGRGVLLFSEDLAETLELSDIVLVMRGGRIVGSFENHGRTLDIEQLGLLMTGGVRDAS